MDSRSRIPSEGPSESLDSWKAIANYLNREVRTVMRWERSRGLPVHRLPGGEKPGVYALRSELDAWRKSSRIHAVDGEERHSVPAVAAAPPSLAVLPFANLSAEKENEYFGDGLADEIITALTRETALRVTARTSSFAFRGKEQDVRTIGERLSVGALLEGSVQRAGGRVRVTAQLVSTADGFHLWSERYDRDLTDIFAIQEDIAGAIAAALKVKLATPAAAARKRTGNLEAYNLWLKGRHHQYSRHSLEDFTKAGECFTRACALDPDYAAAHLGLAEHFRDLAVLGVLPPGQVAAQGRAEVEKALELDDSLGEAHATLGTFRAVFQYDWAGAGRAFATALKLDPGSPLVHSSYAVYLLAPTMRLEQAETELNRTLELDPLSPASHFLLAMVLFFRRAYDRAEAVIRNATDLRANFPTAVWLRGMIAAMQGRFEEAIEHCESAARLFGGAPMPSAMLGLLYGWAGRVEKARRVLEQLQQAARTTYISPACHAWVHLGLGDIDQAFQWLDRAIDEHDPHVIHLPVKPIYDSLREDARFTALLEKMSSPLPHSVQ